MARKRIEEKSGTIEEYREFLSIDRDDLDTALATQSEVYFRVSEEVALAASRRDAAAENIKRVDAEVELAIRRNAEDDGEKLTEGAVKARLQEDKEHIGARDKYLLLNKQVAELEAFKDAWRMRSYMLRELVSLYVAGYFTTATGGGAKRVHDDKDYSDRRERIKKDRQRRSRVGDDD